MVASPSTRNYSIPRGTVQFTPTGGLQTNLGNCTQFRYTADITKLQHYSSMAGIRTLDKSVVTQLGATISMVLDEINIFNLALFVLGDTATTAEIEGLTNTTLTGELVFTGTNDVGTQVNFTGQVQFQPGGDFNMITENDWQNIPLNAEVLLSGGAYGVWTLDDEPTA